MTSGFYRVVILLRSVSNCVQDRFVASLMIWAHLHTKMTLSLEIGSVTLLGAKVAPYSVSPLMMTKGNSDM